MTPQPTIHVALPEGERTIVLSQDAKGLLVAELLRRENLPLNTRCGQRGLCDGCLVELSQPDGSARMVRACELAADFACDVRLTVPARSLLRYAPQVVTSFRTNVSVGRDPLWAEARAGDLGAAIDIGTTTVVVMLVELGEGRILATSAGFNRQMHLGDDVLTRINLCSIDKSMIDTLRKAVIDQTIVPLLRESLQSAGATASRLKTVAVAGNATMLHLFAGVDPTSMGVAPFTPAFLEHRVSDGLAIDGTSPEVHLLPGSAAYVGADLSAGIFATGLLYEDGPSLLVDIGTNGEIILKHDGKLYGCATAAGPAFEGAGLECGLRAGDGAIERIRLSRDPLSVEIEVIGGVNPAGICGSAYVDFLAQGRRTGILSATGRLDPTDSDELIGSWQEHGQALRVAWGAGRQPVVISERDVAKLLQAKAAIAAGILTLLERVHLKPADVKTLHLAGGFGMHISVANAIGCGLLPGFREDQIEVVGNTSLAGAYLTLLDRTVLDELERIRVSMSIVELNLDPNFESRFVDQLALP